MRYVDWSGGGAHLSVDAVGSPAACRTGILSLRRRGRHVQVGLLPPAAGRAEVPMERVIGWELDVLGSHGMGAADYPALLAAKADQFIQSFAPLGAGTPEVFPSPPLHYRLRAEFRIIHDRENRGRIDYAMFAAADPKTPVAIDTFPAADESICRLMPRARCALSDAWATTGAAITSCRPAMVVRWWNWRRGP